MKKLRRSSILIAMLIVSFVILIAGCSSTNSETQENNQKVKLVLADPQWDSVQFCNSVAQYIIEKGYGYPTEIMSGSSAITFEGLVNGDIDILLEAWSNNLQPLYNEEIKKGTVQELGINYDDNAQGLYVPTYLIKGDPERNIAALAPDLKSVQDLPQYWELFKDPEEPSKGVIYGSPAGWEVDNILQAKVKSYNLDENYNYLSPGSDTALAASITKAYKEGKPWLGYYWSPTWITGKYDMTLLSDNPYSKEAWNNGYQTEFPPVKVTIVANKDLSSKAPEVADFLKNFKTNSALLSEVLSYMQDNNIKADQAAIWFLETKQDVWMPWVSDDIATKVKESL